MNRRKFLKKSFLGGSIIAFGGGYFWLKSGYGPENLNLSQMITHLNTLKGQSIKSKGEWNPAQIFNHLAQSIEYSILGYPQHKSDLFKNTLGISAFSVFVTRGEMTHGLSEPIPGASSLDDIDVTKAIDRLLQSLIGFNKHTGKLKPHFAYGNLTKQEYTYAHLMHINNHFEEITIDA